MILFEYTCFPIATHLTIIFCNSGIYLEHPDFGGRAKWGFDAVDSPSPETDGNGHGTHVAGEILRSQSCRWLEALLEQC